MFTFRPFRNSDPPHLLRIWADCAGKPGLIQPLTLPYLERSVLNKPYFDPNGLILAFDSDHPIGFGHAGFLPKETEQGKLTLEEGITCMLMVSRECDQQAVAEELLTRCESYLMASGARTLYGGSPNPCHPFYLGLYGGFRLPGIILSDTLLTALFRNHGYDIVDEYLRFQVHHEGCRHLLDGEILSRFAGFRVQRTIDPAPVSWCEALCFCESEVIQYTLINPANEQRVARVRFCRLDPNPHTRPAFGLAEVRTAASWAGTGADLFLMEEALCAIWTEGVGIVEAQCSQKNATLAEALRTFGFQQCTSGVVYHKSIR